jgi:hypothetical protein
MSGLGSSSLQDKGSVMDSFLSVGEEKKAKDTEKENYNIQKGVRLSERQNANLEDLKVALGTLNDAEAIRWALDKLFELRGEEIKELADKKRVMSLS